MAFNINGAAVPAPSKQKMKYAELSSEDSGRDLSGTMHKDIVAVKRTVDCEWQGLTLAEVNTLVAAAKSAATMTLTCYDHRTAADVTMTVYSGDFDIDPYNLALGIVDCASCTFIEV